MGNGCITLGQLVGRIAMLDVACRRCDRWGRLRLAALVERHGEAMDLPDLRFLLAGDCPRLRSTAIYERCGAYFPQLPGLFRPSGNG